MSFAARYPGTCADCDERFSEGARVMYDHTGELVHVVCPGQPDDVSMSETPCERCFCYHVGECA